MIFPGDWHVLSSSINEGHAGLKEIADASEYRAETLKLLDKFSHFKRTHSFLLQVWESLYSEMINAFAAAYPQFNILNILSLLELTCKFASYTLYNNNYTMQMGYFCDYRGVQSCCTHTSEPERLLH